MHERQQRQVVKVTDNPEQIPQLFESGASFVVLKRPGATSLVLLCAREQFYHRLRRPIYNIRLNATNIKGPEIFGFSVNADLEVLLHELVRGFYHIAYEP